MSTVDELKTQLATTQKDLDFYKNKVRDVVRAYKSLESEKKALESVVATIKDDGSTNAADSPAASADTLKVALADLTREKAKREQAYISDKKALVEEVERQKTKVEKLSQQLEDAHAQLNKAAKIVEKVKDQKAIIRQIEAERDRELQDHGCVLAEMQKRYAEEKTRADKLTKQIAEMYKKAQDTEGMPAVLKQKEQDYRAEVQRLETEIAEWKKKAAVTPTVQLLQNQIENLKADHEHAVKEAVLKVSHDSGRSDVEERRRRELEERLVALSEQAVTAERRAHIAEAHASDLTEQMAQLEKKSQEANAETAEPVDPLDLLDAARNLLPRLQKERPEVDLYDLVGARAEILSLKAKYDRMEDSFEKYKLRAEAVLKSKNNAKEQEDHDDGMRALVSQLHEKMRGLELAAATDRAQYEMNMRTMQERVNELETSEAQCRREMRAEMASKISEMELEMQKQRARTLDLLAEKEKELEATRSILVSVRSEQLSSGAPADPPHKQQVKRKSSEIRSYERRRSSGMRHRSTDSISSAVEYHSESNTQLPLTNESRNIYYEEELSKKDGEIRELRSQLHHLDFRMREVEQNHLTKDLQHHEMDAHLKEEIRVLEGKLRLISTGGDMEYLRNIFVQLLQCDNSSGKKNILKAMGMCLKLSSTEMKAIDKKGV